MNVGISGVTNDRNFIRMTIFPFQYMSSGGIVHASLTHLYVILLVRGDIVHASLTHLYVILLVRGDIVRACSILGTDGVVWETGQQSPGRPTAHAYVSHSRSHPHHIITQPSYPLDNITQQTWGPLGPVQLVVGCTGGYGGDICINIQLLGILRHCYHTGDHYKMACGVSWSSVFISHVV